MPFDVTNDLLHVRVVVVGVFGDLSFADLNDPSPGQMTNTFTALFARRLTDRLRFLGIEPFLKHRRRHVHGLAEVTSDLSPVISASSHASYLTVATKRNPRSA